MRAPMSGSTTSVARQARIHHATPSTLDHSRYTYMEGTR